MDFPGPPVYVRVVSLKPGKPQNQRETRLAQDVELNPFHVVPGKDHFHWSGLMSGLGLGLGSIVAKARGPVPTVKATSLLMRSTCFLVNQHDQLVRAP